MLTVVDENGKTQNVQWIRKIRHKTKDARTGDTIWQDYVEMQVVGKKTGRKWKTFEEMLKFKANNPTVEIPNE